MWHNQLFNATPLAILQGVCGDPAAEEEVADCTDASRGSFRTPPVLTSDLVAGELCAIETLTAPLMQVSMGGVQAWLDSAVYGMRLVG